MATTKKKKKKTTTKKMTGREAAAALREDFDDEGGGGDIYDTLEKGKNPRRILSAADPIDPFWVEFQTHFNLGPDGKKAVRCIEPGGALGMPKDRRTKAEVCPVCKEFAKLKRIAFKFPKGSKKGLKAWDEAKQYRARRQFVVNSYNPTLDEVDVRATKFGATVMDQLMTIYHDEEEYGDFTDIKSGRIINITKKTGKSYTDTSYSVSPSTKKSRIRNWAELMEELHDLEAVAGELLEPEDIENIMEGVELDDDEEEDEDLDDDDDDEDEFDDDEEDDEFDDDEEDDDDEDEEEEDDDDEDEEEEEEERPKKRRKKKKAPVKKKRRRS